MPVPFDGDPSIDSFVREAAATSLLSYPGQFSGTERYEMVRKLGEGGFGVVFEVIDHRQGGRLALKLLRQPYAERLYRFKREFRALAEKIHPNLVRLYEMTAAGRDVFFTMELVEGVPFLQYVARSPERARAATRQLAEGLAALHAQKTLHRDVKPSNVMVDGAGRVVLLDFGLALDLDTGESSELVGTPLYMSPEQCAEEPLGEPSDWYAVGLLLFEALTGRTPFDGGLRQLLDAKQSLLAPPPSRIVSGIPEDLDQLCAELLQRDPAARPSGEEVLRRLSAAAPARVDSMPFVGRAAELAALHAQAAAGGCRVALARGPSGIGKSALLRRFVDELRRARPETVVLAGRCYERESVPYKALDSVLDALARHLKRLPDVEAAALLPREAAALERLFPVLRQVPVFQQQRGGRELEPSEVRRRGVAALRELLARLGDRHPVVVCVDDLQWGDVDSASLLADLVRGPDAPNVFWLASFREEEATTSPLLKRLAQLRETVLRGAEVLELALGPLGGDDARELAAELLAEVHGDAADAAAIAGESGGNPFFVQELARRGGGEAGLDQLVQRRTAALEGAARRVLEVVAVAARPVELESVAAAAGVGDELRDILSHLRAERLIRGRDNELIESYHDRIREAVAGAILPERLRQIHLAVAEALEHHGRADAAQIGQHLAEGGEPARAAGYIVRAAEAAAAALAFDEAVRLYRRAMELSRGPDTALELAFAETLSAAGHSVEAARVWLAALDRVDEGLRLELQRRAAEELLLSGQVDEGYAVMSAVLAQLGLSAPRGAKGALARVVLGRVRQAVLGRRFRTTDQPVGERVRMRVDTVVGLTWAAWVVDPLMGAALQAQHLRLALSSGDPARASVALMVEAMVSAAGGVPSRKRTHGMLDDARALVANLDVPAVPTVLASVEGMVAVLEGRWLDAHERLREADGLCAAVSSWPGHGSLRGHVRTMQMVALFWLGRAGDLRRLAPSLLRTAGERGNFANWVWLRLLEGWALGCTGEVEAGLAAAQEVRERLPEGRFELPRWYLDYGHVKYALEQRDGEEAWRRVEAARRGSRSALTSQAQRISGLWVSAAAALARSGQNRAARDAMLAETRRLIGRIERERAPWADGIVRGLSAGIASVAGDHEQALRLLAETEPLFEAHHFELPLAAVRAARGRLLGGDAGRELRDQAAAWTAAQQISPDALWMHLPGEWGS